MIIPTGTAVIIKRKGFLCGASATVIGYRDPPGETALLRLELQGDTMFKWPLCFPWEVEVVNDNSARVLFDKGIEFVYNKGV